MEVKLLTSMRFPMIKAEVFLSYSKLFGPQAPHTQLKLVLSIREKLTRSRSEQLTQSDTVFTQSLFQ